MIESMEDVIDSRIGSIAEDTGELFAFAYWLRKYDFKDKYSGDLLQNRIKSQTLLEIIMSNIWDWKQHQMVCKPGINFTFSLGNRLVMQHNNESEGLHDF